MFSNTASIFAITSPFADGWDDAIGDSTVNKFKSYEICLSNCCSVRERILNDHIKVPISRLSHYQART